MRHKFVCHPASCNDILKCENKTAEAWLARARELNPDKRAEQTRHAFTLYSHTHDHSNLDITSSFAEFRRCNYIKGIRTETRFRASKPFILRCYRLTASAIECACPPLHALHAFTNARAFSLIHFIHYCFHLVPFIA